MPQSLEKHTVRKICAEILVGRIPIHGISLIVSRRLAGYFSLDKSIYFIIMKKIFNLQKKKIRYVKYAYISWAGHLYDHLLAHKFNNIW